MFKIYDMNDIRETILSCVGMVCIAMLFGLGMILYIVENSMIADAVVTGVFLLGIDVASIIAIILGHLTELEWQIMHFKEEEA